MEPDLDEAEAVMSAHESSLKTPTLTEAEKSAMRKFCIQSIQLKKSQVNLKKEKEQFTTTVKENRNKLQEWIRSQEQKCYILPKQFYKEKERELEAIGVSDLPCYLRMQKNTSDSSITPSVAETAIMQVNEDLYLEKVQQGKNTMKALIESIMDNVRNTVRSSKETIALSKNSEKGLKPMEIEEVPEDIAELMVDMYKAQQLASLKASDKKEKTTELNQSLKSLEPTVASILEKAGESSQQVTLDGFPGKHRIKKKVVAKATGKINLTKFEEIVTGVLQGLPLETTSPKQTLQSFKAYRKELVKRVQLQLTSIPKKEVVNVKLVSKYESDEEME